MSQVKGTLERYGRYRLWLARPAGRTTLKELAEEIQKLDGQEFIMTVPIEGREYGRK